MGNPSLLWLFIGLLFIGISTPLIREKVPPNRWYGFRVPKTFSDTGIWYAANRLAGYDLLWAGGAIATTAIATGLFMDQLGPVTANTLNLAFFIGSVSAALLHSFWTLRQL